MKTSIANYLLNCFLLTLPILVWDLNFSSQLPKAYDPKSFWKDIPPAIAYGENIFRMAILILPILMPLRVSTNSQKGGVLVYGIGVLIYFASWIAQIAFPGSAWSISVLGFLAPAYTPLVWLIGIGMIGDTLFFPSPYRPWVYFLLSIVFVIFHSLHGLTVYMRTL